MPEDCNCTKRSPYDCLAEERQIPYRVAVEAGGCRCTLCDHEKWPKGCACKEEDPVSCAISFGHGAALKYCHCVCHRAAAPSRAPEQETGRAAVRSGLGDNEPGDRSANWQPEDELC